jgi:hypothetical protein
MPQPLLGLAWRAKAAEEGGLCHFQKKGVAARGISAGMMIRTEARYG